MLAGFLTPALILVIALSLDPVIDVFLLGPHATEFARETAFAGLDNYVALVSDPTTWLQLGMSLVYTRGSLALALPFSLALALLRNRPLPFRGLFRTIAILPWAVRGGRANSDSPISGKSA